MNKLDCTTAHSPIRPEPVKSPFVIEFYMVQSAGNRHMAFLDDSGTWREAYSHRELREPVKVVG